MNLLQKLLTIDKFRVEQWKARHSLVGRSFLSRPEAMDRLLRHVIILAAPADFLTPVIKRLLLSPGQLEKALNQIRIHMENRLPGFSDRLVDALNSLRRPEDVHGAPVHEGVAGDNDPRLSALRKDFFEGRILGPDREKMDAVLVQCFSEEWLNFYGLLRVAETAVNKGNVSEIFFARLAMYFNISLDMLATMKEEEQSREVLLDKYDAARVDKVATQWLIRTIKKHYLDEIDEIDRHLKKPNELTSPLAASFRGYLLTDIEKIEEKTPPVTDFCYVDLCDSLDVRLGRVRRGFEAGKSRRHFSETLGRLSGSGDTDSLPLPGNGHAGNDTGDSVRLVDIVNAIRKDRQSCLVGEMKLQTFLEKYS